MSVLDTKLHIKDTNDGNKVYECNLYTTTDEATPNGGSTWELKSNGTTCYVGLLPTSNSDTTFRTPLIMKKDGVAYYVQSEVGGNIIGTVQLTLGEYYEEEYNEETDDYDIYVLSFGYTTYNDWFYGQGLSPNTIGSYVIKAITYDYLPGSQETLWVTVKGPKVASITVTMLGYTINLSYYNTSNGDEHTYRRTNMMNDYRAIDNYMGENGPNNATIPVQLELVKQ